MSDYTYHCPFCSHEFDQDFWDRGFAPICPKCGEQDIITTEQHEENQRINAQEAYNEGWRE